MNGPVALVAKGLEPHLVSAFLASLINTSSKSRKIGMLSFNNQAETYGAMHD